MTPADEDPAHRDSTESIKQGRPVQRAAERLRRDAERMERESAELREEIEHVRADWKRKRADSEIPGAIPLDDEGASEEGDVTPSGGEAEAQKDT